MKPCVPSLLLWLLLLGACQPGRKLNRPATGLLKATALRYIECLNQQDISCLSNVYSDDFEGLAPKVHYSSKQELLERIAENYSQNNWKIEARIVEWQEGPKVGYVLLDWQILQPRPGGEARKMFDNRHLQIWAFKAGEGWQLKRSVFYDPDAILF